MPLHSRSCRWGATRSLEPHVHPVRVLRQLTTTRARGLPWLSEVAGVGNQSCHAQVIVSDGELHYWTGKKKERKTKAGAAVTDRLIMDVACELNEARGSFADTEKSQYMFARVLYQAIYQHTACVRHPRSKMGSACSFRGTRV